MSIKSDWNEVFKDSIAFHDKWEEGFSLEDFDEFELDWLTLFDEVATKDLRYNGRASEDLMNWKYQDRGHDDYQQMSIADLTSHMINYVMYCSDRWCLERLMTNHAMYNELRKKVIAND